jgi:hypothetical protein
VPALRDVSLPSGVERTPRRVLVVDDDPEIRAELAYRLGRAAYADYNSKPLDYDEIESSVDRIICAA